MAAFGFLTATVASLAVCGIVYALGHHIGLVDIPDDDLKTHRRPVVPLGGAGVMVGTHLGLAVVGELDPALLVATSAVWLLGLADDIRGLSPTVRLLGAAVAGFALASMSPVPDSPFGLAVWVVATVVMVNATNLLDGMDGLVAVVSIVTLGGFGVLALVQDSSTIASFSVTIGAVIGFMLWNWPPARLFLGDNGAYVIGVVLTWGAMQVTLDDDGFGVVGLAMVGIPILDLGITVGRRLMAGRSLTVGDRGHTYDRLEASGWSIPRIIVAFAAAQLVWVTVVILVAAVAGDLLAVVVALVLGALTVGLGSIRPKPRSAA